MGFLLKHLFDCSADSWEDTLTILLGKLVNTGA